MSMGIEKLQDMVIKMLEKPKIFIFGDILDLPSVKRLQSHKDFKRYYNTLKLFAYGSFQRYMTLKDTIDFVELTPAMVKKLRYLSIIDLAQTRQLVPYDLLLDTLKMERVRELEDFLIEAMFSGIIEGCMQQSKNMLFISKVVARDVVNRESAKRSSDNGDVKRSSSSEVAGKKSRTENLTESH